MTRDWISQHECSGLHPSCQITHLPLDKMAAISQTIFSDALTWMRSVVFWLKFHLHLYLRVQCLLTTLCFARVLISVHSKDCWSIQQRPAWAVIFNLGIYMNGSAISHMIFVHAICLSHCLLRKTHHQSLCITNNKYRKIFMETYIR